MSPRRVLVTGAGGFVGANLARRLVADGHDLLLVVSPGALSWRLEPLRADVRLAEADLRDWDAARAVAATHRPEWVFHLAAYGAYSWQTDVRRMFETNALGTVALLEACAAAGTEAFVHAGSSSEYGFKDHAPPENTFLEPNSAYAVAKSAATLYCTHAAKAFGLRAATLRLYSVYGPYEEPNRLVPQLVTRGMQGGLPPLVDPDTARDFIFVDDVCDAFLAAAARTQPWAVYNVGTGQPTTVRDIVDVARRHLSISVEPEWGSHPARSWDTSIWIANSSRIEAELDWRARVSLEDGFARTVEWMRSNPYFSTVYGC